MFTKAPPISQPFRTSPFPPSIPRAFTFSLRLHTATSHAMPLVFRPCMNSTSSFCQICIPRRPSSYMTLQRSSRPFTLRPCLIAASADRPSGAPEALPVPAIRTVAAAIVAKRNAASGGHRVITKSSILLRSSKELQIEKE